MGDRIDALKKVPRKRKAPENYAFDPTLEKELKIALELSKRESLTTDQTVQSNSIPIVQTLPRPPKSNLPAKPTNSADEEGRKQRRLINSGISAPISRDKGPFPKNRDERGKSNHHEVSSPLNTGGYHGVTHTNGRWLSHILYKGQSRILGSFDSSVEAACAYDEMALRMNQSRNDSFNRPLNFERFNGPTCRFGYGLVQSQGYLKDGFTLRKFKEGSKQVPNFTHRQVEKGENLFWVDDLLRKG